MTPALKLALWAIALLGPMIGTVVYIQVLSPDNWVYEGAQRWMDGGLHAAPAPIAGAGLPALVVGGAFWMVRRFRRKSG